MNTSSQNAFSINLSEKESVKYNFGFCEDPLSENQLNNLKYTDLNIFAGLELYSSDIFKILVGDEPERVEYMTLLLFFFRYAKQKNEDLLVNIALFNDETDSEAGFYPHTSVKVLAITGKSLLLEKNNDQLSVKYDDIDSFEVVGLNLDKEVKLFLRTNCHLLLTIHGYAHFLTKLIDGEIQKETTIHFKNLDQDTFSGCFFIITDGQLYLKGIHQIAWANRCGGISGGGGPHCEDIQKVDLQNLVSIEVK